MAIAYAVWLAASPAAAEDRSEDELVRWIPGFAASFDMLQHKGRGQIQTSNVIGSPLTEGGCLLTQNVRNPNPPPLQIPVTTRTGTLCENSPPLIAPATSSADTDVVPLVNFSLDVLTPRLVEPFFSPRLFAHADIGISFGFERTLAGERKPGPFFVEPLPPNRAEYSEGEVAGQGSRAKMQIRPMVVGAGGGVAFTAVVFGRKLRVKPSFEYMYEEVDLIGTVHRAVKVNDPARTFNDFRQLALTADSRETLHGLGGGLEIEADAGRLGPVMMSIFVLGRGYRFTGNLNHTLQATNEFGETATWHFELDPWTYRGAVGARFRWLPE
jgi:hypothetical protein